MDTPTLVLILVVVATFVVFGPRPKRNRQPQSPKPVKAKRERVSSMTPLYVADMQGEYRSTHAAARATSPLRQPHMKPAVPQFAVADESGESWEGAPLPHELPSQGESMLKGRQL